SMDNHGIYIAFCVGLIKCSRYKIYNRGHRLDHGCIIRPANRCIRGEEEFDRVYQRIQLEEQENRRNIARRRHRRIRFYLRDATHVLTENSTQQRLIRYH
ncbi:hypothetical protein L9F63_021275, partial [Diploptera punctata]